MKVIFTRNTVAGGIARTIGETADLPDAEAKLLIGMHKASAITPTLSQEEKVNAVGDISTEMTTADMQTVETTTGKRQKRAK